MAGFVNRIALWVGRPYVHRADQRFDEILATQHAILDQLQAIGYALARLEDRLDERLDQDDPA